jgi:hypothetical protein
MQARAIGGTLLAAIAVGIVAIAVWVLRSDDSGARRAPTTTTAPAPKVEDAPPPPPEPARSAARAVEPIASPPVEEPPEPIGVALTVVDAATELPVPDAEVWWIDAGEEDKAECEALRNDLDRLVDRFGKKLELDRDACVQLPANPSVEVLARAPDRLARKVVPVSDGPRQRLLLLPDQPLRVRVVDAHGGRRGDVPVVLESVDAAEAKYDPESEPKAERDPYRKTVPVRQDTARGKPETIWEGRTPVSGEDAEVPHGALLLMLSTEPDRVARARVLRFRIDVPMDVPATALVDPLLDVHQAVELVAPDLAKLRVVLVEPGGASHRGAFRVVTRGAADKKTPESASSQPPTKSGASEDGSPVECLVPVGPKVEVTAFPEDTLFLPATQTVASPEHENDLRDVALTLERATRRRSQTVTGRAIDPDGRVLANTAIYWGMYFGWGGVASGSSAPIAHSDAQGLFSIPRSADGKGAWKVMPLWAPWSGSTSGLDPRMSAGISVGARPADGAIDVGDVHFEALALLLAGHVVDVRGRGVPFATVTAETPETASKLPKETHILGSSRSGAFEMRGSWKTSSMDVRASLQDWFVPGTTVDEHGRLVVPAKNVAVGATDVRIELHRCGAVRGELRVDAGLEPSDVVLEARPRDAARVVRGPENSFRIVGIPGTCSLDVRSRSGSLLAQVDEIRLEDDTVRSDDRLSPLDLSAVFRMPVLVTDAAGVPVAGADLALLPPVGHALAREHAKTDPFGREVVIGALGDGPLWVGARGLHFQRVPLEAIAKTIRLAPGIRVVGSLDVPPDLPETILACVTARHQGWNDPSDLLLGGLSTLSTWKPLRDGSFEVVVSGASDYSIEFWLRDASHPDSRGRGLAAQEVAVVETSEPQRFRIDVSAEYLTASIARLQR